MPKDFTLPLYAEDLVKELAASIPEKCPALSDTDRDTWMYVGKRELVRSLEARLKSTIKKEGG